MIAQQATSPRVLQGIQYLRGLCALLVVVSHENGFLAFPEYFGRSVFPSLHEVAVFSVAAFFAISGFIIVVTSLDEQGRARHDQSNFARKRITRIMPFLWACAALYAALRFAGTGLLDTGSLLRTMFVWPTGELRPNVAWSLRHEMAFYVVFALTMLGNRKSTALLVAWLLAPIAYGLWMSFTGHIPSDLDPWSTTAALTNIIGGGVNGANLQFMIGIAVGLAYLRGRLRENWPAWVLPVTFIASCLVVFEMPLEPGIGRQALWTILAGGLVYTACRTIPAKGPIGRIGLLFGDASFSIYLVHNLVMLILLALSTRLSLALESLLQLGTYLAGCVIVSLAVCCAVHHAVEKPLIKLANRLWLATTTHKPKVNQ